MHPVSSTEIETMSAPMLAEFIIRGSLSYRRVVDCLEMTEENKKLERINNILSFLAMQQNQLKAG